MTSMTYSAVSYTEKTAAYVSSVFARAILREARSYGYACGAVFLCGMLFLSACSSSPVSFTVHGEALGTFYTITVVAPPEDMTDVRVTEIADKALDRINRLMSTYREDSELSRFNRHDQSAPFPVNEETYKVFEIAQEIAAQSGGAFDVTVGPLVNAWGFGPDALKNPPDETAITALLQRTGYGKITLHPGPAISKARPDVYCDLSAIAKGYAVDAVAEAFEQAGITRYMIEVGGEIRVAGKNPRGEAWTLGIETPKSGVRELHTAIRLEQGALATSGDYRNMYELDGRLISHTIDPHTGYPVQHALASASVIHPSCTWADGYATALMSLGPEKALEFARKQGLAVLLLVHDANSNTFKEFSTPGFEAYRVKPAGT
ncbi:MAG: Thiamine biosynthesis lipoprotein ApbE precursor [Candidatus Hydrogenedentes bacterium ADurb.Bin101]|nr:MAG: Thiamine biosynthesis lipoprotein ApbE precursor [Candidatus Hydrogenedentes bacterium ADurb.Bin101]